MGVRLALALRWRLDWPEDWAVWVLRLGVLASAPAALLSPAATRYTEPGPLLATAVVGLLVSLGLSALPSARPRTLRLVELAVLVAIAVHLAGHLFGFYHRIPWYDTVLHAFSGFAAGMAAWGLSVSTRWFWDPQDETPFRAFYLVISFVALAVVLLEFLEFGADRLLGTREQADPVQDPLTDTMVDLVAGMATGALAAAAVAVLTWVGRRLGFDEVTERPKAPPRSTLRIG